jgi:hypothetical protein
VGAGEMRENSHFSMENGQYSPGGIVKKKVYKRRIPEDSQ